MKEDSLPASILFLHCPAGAQAVPLPFSDSPDASQFSSFEAQGDATSSKSPSGL